MKTTLWVLQPAQALWKFLSRFWANGNRQCHFDSFRDFIGISEDDRSAEFREYFCSCGNRQHTQVVLLHYYN